MITYVGIVARDTFSGFDHQRVWESADFDTYAEAAAAANEYRRDNNLVEDTDLGYFRTIVAERFTKLHNN